MYAFIYMHTCVGICMHIHMHICVCVCVCLCVLEKYRYHVTPLFTAHPKSPFADWLIHQLLLVCIYICIYTHTYIYIFLFIFLYTHTYIYIYIYIYIYVHMHMYVCIRKYIYYRTPLFTAHPKSLFMDWLRHHPLLVCIYKYIYTHIYIYIYSFVYTHTHIDIYVHMHMCVCIRQHIYYITPLFTAHPKSLFTDWLRHRLLLFQWTEGEAEEDQGQVL